MVHVSRSYGKSWFNSRLKVCWARQLFLPLFFSSLSCDNQIDNDWNHQKDAGKNHQADFNVIGQRCLLNKEPKGNRYD